MAVRTERPRRSRPSQRRRAKSVATKRRTRILVEEGLLKKTRRALKASTNTEAITKSLEKVLLEKEIEVALDRLIRKGRGRFVDVYK